MTHRRKNIFNFFYCIYSTTFSREKCVTMVRNLAFNPCLILFLNFHFFPQMDEKEDVIPK